MGLRSTCIRVKNVQHYYLLYSLSLCCPWTWGSTGPASILHFTHSEEMDTHQQDLDYTQDAQCERPGLQEAVRHLEPRVCDCKPTIDSSQGVLEHHIEILHWTSIPDFLSHFSVPKNISSFIIIHPFGPREFYEYFICAAADLWILALVPPLSTSSHPSATVFCTLILSYPLHLYALQHFSDCSWVLHRDQDTAHSCDEMSSTALP